MRPAVVVVQHVVAVKTVMLAVFTQAKMPEVLE